MLCLVGLLAHVLAYGVGGHCMHIIMLLITWLSFALMDVRHCIPDFAPLTYSPCNHQWEGGDSHFAGFTLVQALSGNSASIHHVARQL